MSTEEEDQKTSSLDSGEETESSLSPQTRTSPHLQVCGIPSLSKCALGEGGNTTGPLFTIPLHRETTESVADKGET